MPSISELCGLRVSVESYVNPKGPLQCKRCQRFGHKQRICGYAPQTQCCGCECKDTTSYNGCIKYKEAKAALANRAPVIVWKSAATCNSAAPKAQRAATSAEETDEGEGWNHD